MDIKGSLNKAVLIGNLGQDPELKWLPSGMAVVNFSMATSTGWKDKDGQLQEKTEWHKVIAFGKQAENIGSRAKKGTKILVEGRIETRKWDNKDGVKVSTTEIVTDRFQFLESLGKVGKADVGTGDPAVDESVPTPGDDDLPFQLWHL